MENINLPTIIDIDAKDIEIKKSELTTDDVINLEMLIDDYKNLRETVLSNVKISNEVIKSLTFDMYSNDSVNPEMITAFSNLVSTTNQSLKILTDSYKNIGNVLEQIRKLKSQDPKPSTNENDLKISVSDLIEKLKSNEND